ncbi:MAG: 50S ribosomal protein L22 [Aigarchaeota archaeon]|nr:50S ribosomal protein L22 [Aigarchaeota archaeon]MCX8193138.1 50S ribosomal protein L22 [Nitrososphaeria archaeon]MDW7986761.1 50S ribosomal protein L22 [Nitrososphaerota archaeon]
MPNWGYSVKELDPAKTVKASLREVDVSPKFSREVCRAIIGLSIPKAKKLMEDVIAKKKMIPYRRYRKKRAQHAQTKGPGGYPVKVAKLMLKLLESLEANAEFKGLDPEQVVIRYAVAHKGRVLTKFIERAFGRATPYEKTLTHIELIGEVRE